MVCAAAAGRPGRAVLGMPAAAGRASSARRQKTSPWFSSQGRRSCSRRNCGRRNGSRRSCRAARTLLPSGGRRQYQSGARQGTAPMVAVSLLIVTPRPTLLSLCSSAPLPWHAPSCDWPLAAAPRPAARPTPLPPPSRTSADQSTSDRLQQISYRVEGVRSAERCGWRQSGKPCRSRPSAGPAGGN